MRKNKLEKTIIRVLESPGLVSLSIKTGTYIQKRKNKHYLIEVDKVENNYYYRKVEHTKNKPINLTKFLRLKTFSQPENGNYVMEPGIYRIKNKTIEIIPFNEQCYYRNIGSARIKPLKKKLIQAKRIELDFDDPNPKTIS